ncbi:hypothetical protein LTR84_002050 [Exophiala bonariae]|uniref:Uncharacterized protein n=1 Tax=Exophiala bonariae TaxID=1690606 RepID=A0AAV9NBH0_9EURO|nr:hypothetical protein LTR84_002050 [Exophiala bonariae]
MADKDGVKVQNNKDLFSQLLNLYWKAVAREVQNMILFYNECGELLNVNANELDPNAEIAGENFRKLFRIWTNVPNGTTKVDFEQVPLYKEALRFAKDHYDLQSPQDRFSRYLLQSSAFLDLDVVHEPAQLLFPSHEAGLPNVEQTKTSSNSLLNSLGGLWRGLVCSECSYLIRSPVFYECDNGCPFSPDPPLLIGRTMQTGRIVIDRAVAPEDVVRRLCLSCAVQESHQNICDVDHFSRKRLEPRQEKNVKRFRETISHEEDKRHRAQQGEKPSTRLLLNSLAGSRAWDIGQISSALKSLDTTALFEAYTQTLIKSSLGSTLDEALALVTPAGSFHLSLMFGPLIFEMGVPGTRGVLISPRPLPQLCSSTQAVLSLINSDQDADSIADMQECMDLYLHKKSQDLRILRSPRDVRSRRILGSVKRVYGGAFSGYFTNPDHRRLESSAIDTLREQAALCTFRAGSSTKGRQKKLSRLADKVVQALKPQLEREVGAQLNRLATLMMSKSTKMQWNVFNNCQMFVDRMLRGKDFEYTYPRFPKHLDNAKSRVYPRYLISFGDGLDGAIVNRQQSNSFVSTFCKNKRDQADLIEFIVSQFEKRLLSEEAASLPGSKIHEVAEYLRPWMTLLLEPSAPDSPNMARLSDATANLLWEMPRDTLSILQTHIFRPPSKYTNARSKALDQLEWLGNRLLVLRMLDEFASLAGGFGTALFEMFRNDQASVTGVIIPKSRVFGTIRADERVKVIGPRWFLSYFIIDPKNPQVAWLLDSPKSDLFFKEVNRALSKGWNKIACEMGGPEGDRKLLWALVATLGPVIEFWSATFRGATATFKEDLGISIMPQLGMVGDVIRILRSVTFGLIKKKLYGQEDWLAFNLGMGINVLQQSFKKTKTIRA